MADVPDSIDHPAVWRGDELFARDDWGLEFTPGEIDEFRQAVANDDFSLPKVRQKFLNIQHQLEHGSGACLVKGLPIDDFATVDVRRLFRTMCAVVGTAVSQNAAGDKVFNVRDEGHQIGDAKARGPNTRKRLSFHTDRCDVIAFLCLRQAKAGGENQLVSSAALFNEIRGRRPDLLAVLMEPFYYARHNVDTGNDQPWCRQPIFSIFAGHFACSFLRVLIERTSQIAEIPNLTEEQIEAMNFLEAVAAERKMHATFHQQRGDLLLLNNWVTLHRRNEFVDHEQPGLRRHLLRTWLAVPNSRPLHPDFAANYGATGAGAVRGGMRPQR